jgi:hypothetical protein
MTDPTRISRRQKLTGPMLTPLERATLALSLATDPDEPPLDAREATFICARLLGNEARAVLRERAAARLAGTLDADELADLQTRAEVAYSEIDDIGLRSLEEVAEALERMAV